jgi:hypothetical protein
MPVLSQITHFIGSCRLKNDIKLQVTVPEMQPPDILPIQCSCGISEDGVEICWEFFKGYDLGRARKRADERVSSEGLNI